MGPSRPAGDTVAVVGAGPIELSAIMGAQMYSPSGVIAIDLAGARPDAAKSLGADLTLNNGREAAVAYVKELTERPRGLMWPSRPGLGRWRLSSESRRQ